MEKEELQAYTILRTREENHDPLMSKPPAAEPLAEDKAGGGA